MSRNIIFVLMYHRHKLSEKIISNIPEGYRSLFFSTTIANTYSHFIWKRMSSLNIDGTEIWFAYFSCICSDLLKLEIKLVSVTYILTCNRMLL
jgi:hypothetical protein